MASKQPAQSSTNHHERQQLALMQANVTEVCEAYPKLDPIDPVGRRRSCAVTARPSRGVTMALVGRLRRNVYAAAASAAQIGLSAGVER